MCVRRAAAAAAVIDRRTTQRHQRVCVAVRQPTGRAANWPVATRDTPLEQTCSAGD